jgi:hypothetical protein
VRLDISAACIKQLENNTAPFPGAVLLFLCIMLKFHHALILFVLVIDKAGFYMYNKCYVSSIWNGRILNLEMEVSL